ncbi:hypothetical protein K8I31_08645, partial [bacterium]|nr:hypothetical protein [bacterium]
ARKMRWIQYFKRGQENQKYSSITPPFGIQCEQPSLEVPSSIQVRLAPVFNESGNIYLTQTSKSDGLHRV